MGERPRLYLAGEKTLYIEKNILLKFNHPLLSDFTRRNYDKTVLKRI